ncbi:protein FATTY ACID EXPORT 1, chloroplastic-like [Phragmites australis]|uniref:protein FATTY ACID EXPORT 1, chloroplastic-like n=1 Tax=Phragmites australis TaxID=29695 RepID=UPI002D78E0FE|nr:protein FATTY ACID EXPORT 1, chloroplastic-like [Phragmites australis]XP_062225890.1 protein FATTY ACID EXPORT 1, chloroplastic-like [Phragmites australis]XP_062225891.1 protein FATTY ACID EXPORT 1, chloroplastic-like [Phragmites australis]
MKEFVQVDEHVISQKRSAKIHDFCLGIPFGGLLFSMGLLGYIFSRSTLSLVLGVAPGLATLLLGTLSLKFWWSGRSNFLLILTQAAISAFLTWKYSHAYFLTNRLLPWGFYASLSTAMSCFYAYVLLAGGNPPPKKIAAP